MAPLTLERREGSWLDRHAHDWVEAGLISEGQAAAIRDFEHIGEPAQPQRLTVVAEVATYLGSLIAFAGGAAIVGPNWDELGLIGQLVLGLAIAVIGFVAGARLLGFAEPGTVRLGLFLWVVATGGMALATGAVMNEIDPSDDEWYVIVIGSVVLAISLALWRNLERPLQLLTAVIGAGLVAGGTAGLTEMSVWVGAPFVWVVAAVFGVLALRGYVRPQLMAEAIAAVGLMIGALMFSGESERVGAIAATATAVLIVVIAMRERSIPLLGLGMFAFFIGITSMMQTVLQGMIWRLIAVVVGLAVVAYVAVRAQRMGHTGPPTT